MANAKKLSEDQLKTVNEIVGSLNYVGSKITEFSVEGTRATEAYIQLKKQLEEQKEKIREEFGDVEIDLQTGELKESKSEE
jgi:hypothetical protein|tara:strand:+ start:124 stop:366 length:243 start_codon:yes stop_codon:yes gene_type:complete